MSFSAMNVSLPMVKKMSNEMSDEFEKYLMNLRWVNFLKKWENEWIFLLFWMENFKLHQNSLFNYEDGSQVSVHGYIWSFLVVI